MHLFDELLTFVRALSAFASSFLNVQTAEVFLILCRVVLAEAVPEELNDGLAKEFHPLLVVVVLKNLEEEGKQLVDMALHDVEALLDELLPENQSMGID